MNSKHNIMIGLVITVQINILLRKLEVPERNTEVMGVMGVKISNCGWPISD
jgi:hypothetical protein